MKLYLRLAWRNIWRHKRRTLIVVLAIGLSMSMMMMYDGMIAGFQDAIYGNAIKVLGGNIQIHAAGYSEKVGETPLLPLPDDEAALKAAETQPGVVLASRRINTGGLATNHAGAFAVSITGIEPERELPVSLIAQHVIDGRFLTGADKDVAFIGKGLADAMELKVGDRFTLAGGAQHDEMRQRTMTVGGIFDIGMADIEKLNVYISLPEAQELYGMKDQASEVMMVMDHVGGEGPLMQTLTAALPGTEASSWQTSFPEMESAMTTKSGVMNIFSVIIILIAGIGILNLLLMAVYERTREIGLLGALGYKPRQISTLFLLEGGMMGLVGLAFGVVLGLAVNLYLNQVGLDFGSFSNVSPYMALITTRVHSTLGVEKLLQRSLTVLVICVLAAFIPAREAAQSEPAEALHFV